MQTRHRLASAVGIAAGVLALSVLLAGAANADDRTITLQASPGDGGAWILTATVADASGTGVSGVDVTFSVAATFLGQDHAVSLGTATTDTSGTAQLPYVPSWNGHQLLTASIAGSDEIDSAPVSIDVQDAAPVLPADPPTLGTLRAVAPPAVLLVAAAVWLLIAATFLYALFGVRGHPAARHPRTAMRATPALEGADSGGDT